MKIEKLPTRFKPLSRFTKPDQVKADTHYIFTTKKYVVEIVYHSSMFYAPDFFKVTVKASNGKHIWSGGDSMFLDTLFLTDFISDDYDRMILTRVNSTESSGHMDIILIDLKNGEEDILTEEGAYSAAGHFVSFDCIYYADHNGVHCIDCDTKNSFMLHDILLQHFKEIKTWGACAVKDCILVIAGNEENNVCIFNLMERRVIDSATLFWGHSTSVTLSIGCVNDNETSIVSVSYADKQANGVLKHSHTEHFVLRY